MDINRILNPIVSDDITHSKRLLEDSCDSINSKKLKPIEQIETTETTESQASLITDGLDSIAIRMQSMTELILIRSTISEGELAQILSSMCRLKILNLYGSTNITGNKICNVKLDQLADLNIAACHSLGSDQMVEFLKTNGSYLRVLRFGSKMNLYGLDKSNKFDVSIITTQHCARLRRIYINVYWPDVFVCERSSDQLVHVHILVQRQNTNINQFALEMVNSNRKLETFNVDDASTITSDVYYSLSTLANLHTVIMLRSIIMTSNITYFDGKSSLKVLVLDAKTNRNYSIGCDKLIQHQMNLQILYMQNYNLNKQQLQTILQRCDKLIKLSVSSNNISELDLNNYNIRHLENLVLYNFTKLDSLNVTSCTLKQMQISNSSVRTIMMRSLPLEEFSIVACESLNKLAIKENLSLKKFDINSHHRLTELQIDSVNIERIDVAGCNELKQLRIVSCPNLVHLDASNLPAIVKLKINSSKLESIDLRNNSSLKAVYLISSCKLDTINFSQCTNIGDKYIRSIISSNKQIEILDISNCNLVTESTLNLLLTQTMMCILRLNCLTSVTDDFLNSLAPLSNLVILEINQCVNVISYTICKLLSRKMIPNLKKIGCEGCLKVEHHRFKEYLMN